MILSSLTAVTHVLHVRHGLSDDAVPSLSATLVPPTPWWYTAKLTPAGEVAVVAADRFPDDADDPVVRLSVADHEVAASLDQPLIEVTLGQADQTHTFAPANLTVTVVLTDKDGKPRTGINDTRAVPEVGNAIALPEVAGEPGTYPSPGTARLDHGAAEVRHQGRRHVGRQLPANPFVCDTRLHGVVA